MVKIYYGMSGALKNQTIITESPPDYKIMKSAIKPWKELELGPLKSLIVPGDLNFAALHLIRLQDWINFCGDKLIVERGITDFLFFHFRSQQYHPGRTLEMDINLIKDLVAEENRILGGPCEKILLVQKDPTFVMEKVFEDPHRRATFSGNLDLYLNMQEEYIHFTRTWNTIDRTIEIEDAKEYIEETLKQEYKND